ncbi:GerMN domain-containing protein [Clostridium tertium]|uniref:GerMN domain-containing protein n=1 Tax=Clostridium tertium TaxID=1559 RepID=UPI0024B36A8C|nr:GerMN domain-containing protein [Clostridium tertium]MDI9215796.1 GerMN domain-containing protein [Clostridium tertium]
MKKIVLCIISLVFCMGLLVSCSNKTAAETISKNEELIKLYFSDENAEYLVEEKRSIEDVTPQKAIQALIEGPKGKELKSLLPKELEVVDIVVKDGVAYVKFLFLNMEIMDQAQ